MEGTTMRFSKLGALSLAGLLGVSSVYADDPGWRPIIAQSAPGKPLAQAELVRPAAVALGRPIPVALGRPQPLISPRAETQSTAIQDSLINQASARSILLDPESIVRAQAPEPPPGPPPMTGDPILGPDPYAPPPVGIGADPSTQPGFWSQTKEFIMGPAPVNGCGGARAKWQSDHAFDQFISPVTNPFLFEDPRALTELRPIFLIQSIPSSNWVYKGGNAEFIGIQGRLAITERWSAVINKLGFVAINPGSDSLLSSNSGFAEINLGPKYTFYRNERSGTIAAGGVTFELPAGSSKVFQDTGNLSIVPYVSFGQNFWRTQYGSMNFLTTGGYSFASNTQRSEYLFTSFHLDYDVANWHRFYPLLEFNWFHYTQAGKAEPFSFEGADLVNFGSTGVSGQNQMTIAFGARYKFTEAVQLGTAFEFGLGPTKGIDEFRWTLDMIFRY
jgi:hypothetical protein